MRVKTLSRSKGEYKTQPNSPTNLTTGRIHSYAPVLDTGPEMGRLVAELNAEEFRSAHPVLQASYAHYGFVAVHPFADRNGRVARALTSAYLYRDPGVPFLVFADQKPAYLDALEATDAGSFVAFIGFVTSRSIDAVELIRGEVDRITARLRRDRAISQFRQALESRHGLTHLEIDAVASRLLDEAHTEFVKQN